MNKSRDNPTEGWDLCGESPQEEGNVESYQRYTHVHQDVVVRVATQFPENSMLINNCHITNIIALDLLAY